MECMKKYRNEWKYCCDEGELALLSARIQNILAVDEHALEQEKYVLHSLYFDDYKDTCAYDNVIGLERRYKWRIRYYDGPSTYLHLELKQKLYGRTHKDSCELSKSDYRLIMENRAEELFWKTDNKLLKKFCYAIMTRQFRPKVIIYYERTAYVEPITNIRITLDQNISASNDFDHFLDGNYQKIPLLGGSRHILEVKFDYILPGYIRDIVNSHGFKQISFSKYYIGRKKLEELI